MNILISLGLAMVLLLVLVSVNLLCHWLMDKNPEFWGTVFVILFVIFCILTATFVVYINLFK